MDHYYPIWSISLYTQSLCGPSWSNARSSCVLDIIYVWNDWEPYHILSRCHNIVLGGKNSLYKREYESVNEQLNIYVFLGMNHGQNLKWCWFQEPKQVFQLRGSKLFIFLVICFLQIPTVQAQQYDNLVWGVQDNTVLHYSVTQTGRFTNSSNYDVYMYNQFDVTATIVLFEGYIVTGDRLEFSNGSSARDALVGGVIFAFPIGNWSMVENEIYEEDSDRSYTFFEDESTWGYGFTFSALVSYFSMENVRMDANVTYIMVYTKNDGALRTQEIIYDYYDDDFEGFDFGVFTQIVDRVEDSIPISYVPLIIGGTAIGTIAIILVIHWYQKSRNN